MARQMHGDLSSESVRPPAALCLGEAQTSSGVDCAAAFSGGQNWVGFREHLASLLVFINQSWERAPWAAPWGTRSCQECLPSSTPLWDFGDFSGVSKSPRASG